MTLNEKSHDYFQKLLEANGFTFKTAQTSRGNKTRIYLVNATDNTMPVRLIEKKKRSSDSICIEKSTIHVEIKRSYYYAAGFNHDGIDPELRRGLKLLWEHFQDVQKENLHIYTKAINLPEIA